MNFTSRQLRWEVVLLSALAGCGAQEGSSTSAATDLQADDPALVSETNDAIAAPVPTLNWTDCADGFQCATAALPRDYARPRGAKLNVAVTRLPARNAEQRIGSLFVNFGGPGGTAVAALHNFGKDLFVTLNERFDIVGFDPRGTGETEGAIDCHVDQEKLGLYAQPFTTPQNLNGYIARARAYADACVRDNAAILPYVSTASVARDMDAIRAAMGESKLSYLGFSYGTFLGATYASLFPANYRGLVLDGAIDADQYINRPTDNLRLQSAGFERAFDRFFEACAGNQTACLGFGGSDPHVAYDNLVARANASPLPATGTDPRPVDGEDINWAVFNLLYSKQQWPLLAQMLSSAEAGDGTLVRAIADSGYGRNDDGTYGPGLDRYFALSGAEQRYTSDPSVFLQAGYTSWGMFDHAWWNTGYSELPFGLLSVHARGVFHGPFRASTSAPTVLVVATTYDPATPYRGSVGLVDQLKNARLLTMQGDGHTAYGGNSPCIDAAVDAYLNAGTVPPAGTVCIQDAPFQQIALQASALRARGDVRATLRANLEFVKALH
jgi:pimeloyl-ACP methyl ester carboxylesterase